MFLSFCSRSRRANSSSRRFCSAVKLVGVTTLTMTCWSPRALLCTTGTPMPLRRKERLLCVPAGILRVVALPSTALTHRHIDELPKDGLLQATDFAGSLARRTTRRRRAGLRAAATAVGTGLPTGQFYFLLATENSLLECDGEIIAKISTTLGSSTALGTRCSRKEGFEEVIDAAE